MTASPLYVALGESIARRKHRSWAEREDALLREAMRLMALPWGASSAAALLTGYTRVTA